MAAKRLLLLFTLLVISCNVLAASFDLLVTANGDLEQLVQQDDTDVQEVTLLSALIDAEVNPGN